jgi:hypothetical protein
LIPAGNSAFDIGPPHRATAPGEQARQGHAPK